MERKSNIFRDRHDDTGYRPRARDWKEPPAKKQFEGEDHWEDRRRTRPDRPPPTPTKTFERRAAEPLQGQINEIFSGTIDAAKALEFVDKMGQFCPVVLLADMLSRIGDRMGTHSLLKSRDLLPLMTVMEKVFECFTEADRNLQPRELSSCLRLMGRYNQFFDHRRGQEGIDRQDPTRTEATFDKLLSLWERSRQWESPNLFDFCDAIIGLVTSRGLLTHRVSSPSGNAPALADVLKNTCDDLCSGKVEMNPKFIPLLGSAMRVMVLEAVVSQKFFSYVHEQLWQRDSVGRTAFDKMEAGQIDTLTAKITNLFCCANVELFNPAALEEVESELTHLIASGRGADISLEMIGEFLGASILHKKRPAESLINSLERHAPVAMAQMPDSSPLTMRAAQLASLALVTLQQAPLESTLSMSRSVSGLTPAMSSAIEHRVGQVLGDVCRKHGWQHVHGDFYGPCQLDFRVTIFTPTGDVTVNLEVDGFPYHSVYQIDEGRFSDTKLPPKNVLRDILIRERAGYRVVRVADNDLRLPDGTMKPREEMAKILVDALRRAAGI